MSLAYSADLTADEVPAHLDAGFFQETVENALRETSVQLQRVHFARGSSTGENYCSEIFRVRLDYKLDGGRGAAGTLSVIVKNLLNAGTSQFLDDLQVFLKEKIIYFDVLPRMEILLDEASHHFGARLYHCVKTPQSSYAFEDMCAGGFTLACREIGLDEPHARFVLQRLAQFHAISMYLAKRKPASMLRKPIFSAGMLSPLGLDSDDSMLYRFFAGNAAGLVQLVAGWRGYERIAIKLQRYMANLRANMIAAQTPRSDELLVLNHGDLWTNNMLFRHKATAKDAPVDVVFVDYQYSVWGSPGIDLNYFLNTSLQLDVLREKRESLIDAYYAALSGTLCRLGYAAVPSREQVREEVRAKEAYGFFAQYAICPAVRMPKAACADNTLANLADETFARNKVTQMYSSPRLQEMLRYTLPRFDELGVLD